MPINAETYKSLQSGLGWGGMLSGVAQGVLGAIAAKKQAQYAARLTERQGEIARIQAQNQAYAMEQEALDFLTLADMTAAQSILDAQDVERVGRYRANVVRAQAEQQRGDVRGAAADRGAALDSPGMLLRLSEDAYQSELAALAERWQGEEQGYRIRTEAEQVRHKARIGLESARRGQRLIMAGAETAAQGAQAQAGMMRAQARGDFMSTMLNSFLGPQTLQSVLALIGKKEDKPDDPLGGYNFNPFDFGTPSGGGSGAGEYWG